MSIAARTVHRIEDFRVTCTCGMSVEAIAGSPPRSARELTLWLTRFLCAHEAVANDRESFDAIDRSPPHEQPQEGQPTPEEDDDRLDRLIRLQQRTIELQERTLATLDDLTTTVAALTTEDSNLKAAVDALVSYVHTITPGTLTPIQQQALDAANIAVQTATGQITAETAAAAGAVPAAAPTPPPAAALPLYEYVGTAAIDPAAYPSAGLAGSDGKPLYRFSGDTAGNPPTGATVDWVVYTGATTPTP